MSDKPCLHCRLIEAINAHGERSRRNVVSALAKMLADVIGTVKTPEERVELAIAHAQYFSARRAFVAQAAPSSAPRETGDTRH